jgi:hypothetical protein
MHRPFAPWDMSVSAALIMVIFATISAVILALGFVAIDGIAVSFA